MERVVISADSHVMEPADLWTSRSTPTCATSRRRSRRTTTARLLVPRAGPATVHRVRGVGRGPERRRAEGPPRERRATSRPGRRDGTRPSASRTRTSTASSRGALRHAGHAAVPDDRRRAAAGVLPRLQRLAGRVLCVRADAPSRPRPDLAVGRRRRRARARALRRARAQGRHDLGLPAGRPALLLPTYDRLWAAAQDLELPLSLHIVTGMGDESRVDFTAAAVRYMHMIHEIQRSISSQVVLGGVLERFPR